jgi:Zn-dependent metalloprotease
MSQSQMMCSGSMAKQYSANAKQSAHADWLIGEGIFMPTIRGKALRSMNAPGTAYDVLL